MSEATLVKFKDVESAPWFGMAEEQECLFRSIVSNYDHTLTEAECESNPLQANEYSLSEQLFLKDKFLNFFENQIKCSLFINHDDCKLYIVDTKIIPIVIDRFFKEIFDVFINFEKNIIFCTSHDLEIFIYSKRPLSMKVSKGLHLRAQNDLVKWNETPWH